MDRAAALALSALPDGELFQQAGRIAKNATGADIDLCAIINIRSGHCGMDCKFCVQSRHNATFHGYPLLNEHELTAYIYKLAATPVRHIGLVASGRECAGADFDRLLSIIEKIPDEIKIRLCVSLGQLDRSRMQELRSIGISHCHHNLETSARFYPCICSSQTWESRRDTVLRAMETGMEVCSGAIFGIGESWEDRIDLALSLADLGVSNVPLNFLHPQKDTPFENSQPLEADEALRIIAVYRHILPDARLRVCGGRPITFGARQHEIFTAGANGLMTGDYLTTEGFAIIDDIAMLRRIGAEIDCPGDASATKHWRNEVLPKQTHHKQ